ncbi:MAG: FHA domain-containing protein [Candidatus Promineifilaceae bacterium]
MEINLHWQLHDHAHSYTIHATDEVTIGRREECEVVLPFATISRRHALIYAQDDTFYIRNLSQTNTVRVNEDDRLTYDQTAPLHSGDVIRLGPIELKVESPEQQDDLTALKNKTLKIRCSNCGQVTDYNPESFCPWCGMSLAGSQTVVGIE